MKKIQKHVATLMTAFALLVTSGIVNRGCIIILHQPKLPEGAESFYKE